MGFSLPINLGRVAEVRLPQPRHMQHFLLTLSPDAERCTFGLFYLPALPPPQDRALADLMERLSGQPALQSVSYGTEAGLFHAAGVPSIICGPGSITRAHRPDAFITRDELSACCTMLRRLAESLSGKGQ